MVPGEALPGFIGRFNDAWVCASRRLNQRILRDLLAVSGAPLFAH
jgi:hypothetical protein